MVYFGAEDEKGAIEMKIDIESRLKLINSNDPTVVKSPVENLFAGLVFPAVNCPHNIFISDPQNSRRLVDWERND